MPLSVIGAGFGRTGTLSLKLALERLGYGPCHHLEDLLRDRDQLSHWQALAAGEPVDWDTVLAGYRAAVDWPAAAFWRELASHYPRARVILTVRDPERWWASFAATIAPALHRGGNAADPHVRAVLEMARAVVGDRIFAGQLDNREAAIVAFRDHIDEVRRTIDADRLLELDVAEGWQPLCQFLGEPVPDEPFPHSNAGTDFWQRIGGPAPD